MLHMRKSKETKEFLFERKQLDNQNAITFWKVGERATVIGKTAALPV